MVTLADVARAAGVSKSTVSLVLNDNASIPERTKQRVKEAARQVGYVYNRRAAGLRSQKSGLIAIAINDLESPYFSGVVAGAQSELERQGYMAIISNSFENPAVQSEFLTRIREFSVDGVMICPAAGAQSDMVETVQSWTSSVILFSRSLEGLDADFIGGDNFSGMQKIMRHLIDLGHRNIAHIGSNPGASTSRDRVRAYLGALHEEQIPHEPGRLVECVGTREAGYKAMHHLLQTDKALTAVTCHNDTLAFGVFLALQEAGLAPGRDIAVTGCDNVSEAELWHPGLTTVDVPKSELGRLAAQALTHRLQNPGGARVARKIESKLIVRGSTSPAASITSHRSRFVDGRS
nr:LacI family DNA-binding transcriptional regulator [Ruegeria sp. EL01]